MLGMPSGVMPRSGPGLRVRIGNVDQPLRWSLAERRESTGVELLAAMSRAQPQGSSPALAAGKEHLIVYSV